MGVGVIIPNRNIDVLCSILRESLGEALQIFPHIHSPEKIESLLVWNHPPGIFSQFPRLKLISSLGAGVDHICSDPSLPEQVMVTRVVYPKLGQAMARYAVGAILQFHKSFPAYHQCKATKCWDPDIPIEIDMKIGVMGLGKMGRAVAESLLTLGFEVHGYSRTPTSIPGIHCYSEAQGQLEDFIKQVNTLICLLPLTPKTKGILSFSLFSHLPPGSFLINLGRGQHLIEADLIQAMDRGIIAAAYLDVFQEEPLPQTHPFWTHPQIYLTPHIASITDQEEAARQFVTNHQRMQAGQKLIHQVEQIQGY